MAYDDRQFSYIFDMDGVLIDSLDVYTESFYSVFKEEFGVEISRAHYATLFGTTEMYQIELLCGLHGIETDFDALWKKQHQRALDLSENVKPIKNNVQLAHLLIDSGHKVAVASCSMSDIVSACLKAIGLLGKLAAVVTANDVTRGKPDPQIFLKAAEKLGVDPVDCVVIEDAQFGVDAAKAANMRVMYFIDSGK